MQAEVMFFLRRENTRYHTARMDEPWEGPRWTADTETIFGMMLLLETGRSFFHINDVQNDTNLHDTAVRLAEEVQDNLNRLIEGELAAGQFSNMQPRTVRALERKQAELGVYIKSAGTSLYHQLPWTAGAQMGETLYSALDLGFIVCRSEDILGLCFILITHSGRSHLNSAPLYTFWNSFVTSSRSRCS